MDESGDLGFSPNKRNSKYFVITCLLTDNPKQIEKIVRKTHAELQKNIKRRVGVLHATKEKPTTRQRLLKRICKSECSIIAIYLEKSKVYTRLQNEKHVLYNYVVNILLDRVYTRHLGNRKAPVLFIASRRETNTFLNANFAHYLVQQTKQKHQKEIAIRIKTPHEEKVLQAVDFASWALFRKLENKDDTYYRIIEDTIIEERPLFG